MKKEYTTPEMEIIEFSPADDMANGGIVGGDEVLGSIPEGWE